jgi:DNA modification methylase
LRPNYLRIGFFHLTLIIPENAQNVNEIIDKCFLLPKPTKEEKGEFNIHKTVKPLAICEYIIKLTTFLEDAVVLDLTPSQPINAFEIII